MSLTAMLFAWVIVVALRLRELVADPLMTMRAVMNGAPGFHGWLWGWFGVLWGLIALSNASLLLCFPAMVVWVVWPELRAWTMGSRLRRGLVGVVVACVGVWGGADALGGAE